MDTKNDLLEMEMDGVLYVELLGPPATLLLRRQSFLRRSGLSESQFATLGGTQCDRDHDRICVEPAIGALHVLSSKLLGPAISSSAANRMRTRGL